MSNIEEYKELLAFHPGYYISEYIQELGLSQEEFAQRLGVTAKTISVLVNGKSNLTIDIAEKLSIMLGTSVALWMNLQHSYETKKHEIEKEKWLDHQCNIAKNIDYKYFINIAQLPVVKTLEERVTNLCQYLHVADLSIFSEKDFLVNFRTGISKTTEKNLINSRIWLQTAINIGKTKPETVAFNATKLKSYVSIIRSLSTKPSNIFVKDLEKIFENCGIRFILIPYLKNSGINGAVKWLDYKHPVLAMNDRRCFSDTFWFSLFHEIQHLFQQKTKTVFISSHDEEHEIVDDQLEKEADNYARSILIPTLDYNAFISNRKFNKESIIYFANKLGIHPSIVVGRLQKDKKLPQNSCLNSLKEQYKFFD